MANFPLIPRLKLSYFSHSDTVRLIGEMMPLVEKKSVEIILLGGIGPNNYRYIQ